MKTNVLFVPIKSHSERVPGKNFKQYKGRPLYQHLLRTAKASGVFHLIAVDTDAEEVADWSKAEGMHVIRRLPALARDDANGNDLLRYHTQLLPDFDCYWQGFVTTPNISIGTVHQMSKRLSDSPTYDSVMTVEECRGFYWAATGQPLTYRPDVMPRSQDVPPIYKEKHGLFGIRREAYAKTGNRAGLVPYFHVLPYAESADIDWPQDAAQLEPV